MSIPKLDRVFRMIEVGSREAFCVVLVWKAARICSVVLLALLPVLELLVALE